MKTHAQIVHMLTAKLECAQDSLAKFQAQLQENPVYALSWSQEKFLDAAWVRLATEMLAALGEDKGETAALVAREMQRRVLAAARSPARSSSVTSNLMEQAQAQAAAELLEYVSE